jgi:hypothetical protein
VSNLCQPNSLCRTVSKAGFCVSLCVSLCQQIGLPAPPLGLRYLGEKLAQLEPAAAKACILAGQARGEAGTR